MSENEHNQEKEAKRLLMDDMLLDTNLSPYHSPQRSDTQCFNFEIQLPTLSEFCIDWLQTDYPNKLKQNFDSKQWRLDEVKIWVEEGGSETMVNDEPTGRDMDRSLFEEKLAQYALTLEDLAKHYYPKALAAGRKGYTPRAWHSPFPRKK